MALNVHSVRDCFMIWSSHPDSTVVTAHQHLGYVEIPAYVWKLIVLELCFWLLNTIFCPSIIKRN